MNVRLTRERYIKKQQTVCSFSVRSFYFMGCKKENQSDVPNNDDDLYTLTSFVLLSFDVSCNFISDIFPQLYGAVL